MSNNTLVHNHQWFWTAATGSTNTYLLGETTIPDFGKKDLNDTIYGVCVMGQMAYAELFLNYISSLQKYQDELKHECNSRNKIMLDKDYIQTISGSLIRMSRELNKWRMLLDELNRWQNAVKTQNNNSISKMKNDLKNNGKASAFEKEKARLEAEISAAKNIFEKTSHTFQDILKYREGLLMNFNHNGLQKFMSDFESTKTTLEKVKENKNQYEDLDKAECLIVEAQEKCKQILNEAETFIGDKAKKWATAKKTLGGLDL